MPSAVIKIVVTGPESTGKSTLCTQLADHYRTVWCEEYARTYLADREGYQFEDLLPIAKGQVAQEDAFAEKVKKQNIPLLFIDTDMHVVRIWSEFVFDKCDDWVLEELSVRTYDLYLLCNIDIPWEYDYLREHPDAESRYRLYHMYKDALINQAVPWIDISGDAEERLSKAIIAIDTLLTIDMPALK